MYWVLLDVFLGVAALAVVGFLGFSLYRHVRTLMRAVSDASATVGEASTGLSVQPARGIQAR